MKIDEYLVRNSSQNIFMPLFLSGKFDISGKIFYDQPRDVNEKLNGPESLHNLFKGNEAEQFLQNITTGSNSGEVLINLNTESALQVLWRFKPHEDGIYYLFSAHPVSKHSFIDVLSRNRLMYKIISTCPDMFIVTSTDGEIVYLNPSGYRILNFQQDDKDNISNINELVGNIDKLDPFFKKLCKGESINEIELSIKRQGMVELLGLSSIFPIMHENNCWLCFHVIDISERVKNFSTHMKSSILLTNLNEDLKRTQSQLLNQEKMASVGQLSAGISHEINNPLGYVFNNVNVLLNHMKDIQNFVFRVRDLYNPGGNKSAQIEEISMLDKNIDLDYIFSDLEDLKNETTEGIQKIKSIINSLKSFSQKDSMISYSLNNLNDSLKDTLVILLNEYKYKIQVNTEYGDIPELFCNIHELNQAFLNIIKNGIDMINEDKTIKNGVINIKTFSEGNSVHATIFNTGPPIPDKIMNRIFEPFFTTKAIGSGVGLGLSIAHDIIVNKHKGVIHVQNVDDGVQFKISIPLEEELDSEP